MADEQGKEHQEFHSLEKFRIHERLGDVEKTLAELKIIVENQRGNHELVIQNLGRLLERHDKMLLGTNGAAGMDKRLDRLEQVEKGRAWHLRALWASMTGVLAKWIAEWMNP